MAMKECNENLVKVTRSNIRLVGHEALVIESIRSTQNVEKRESFLCNCELVTEIFRLEEVTVERLTEIRKDKTPCFILKDFERYYYTEIPASLNLIDAKIISPHLCGRLGKECKHMACKNVRDLCPKVAFVEDRAHGMINRIEMYPFIIVGYEVFNTSTDRIFTVCECSKYEAIIPRKKTVNIEGEIAKLSLREIAESIGY